MVSGPAAPTPYEILGVDPNASDAELRRAYRRRLRKTHPDTGGDPVQFQAVQSAWARVGDHESRRRWDAGQQPTGNGSSANAPTGGRSPARGGSGGSTKPAASLRARAHGHPGGLAREQYLTLMREWLGRGTPEADPYDEALIRTAPREIRQLLAKALAEESTVKAVSALGIGYTIWSGVRTNQGVLDHIVLGPAGLFAIASENWGGVVRLVRGELVGDQIGDPIPAGRTPVRELAQKAKAFGRTAKVRFTGSIIVVPDSDFSEAIGLIGRKRDCAVVQLGALPAALRNGLGEDQRLSIEDVFDVRSRLQVAVKFV